MLRRSFSDSVLGEPAEYRFLGSLPTVASVHSLVWGAGPHTGHVQGGRGTSPPSPSLKGIPQPSFQGTLPPPPLPRRVRGRRGQRQGWSLAWSQSFDHVSSRGNQVEGVNLPSHHCVSHCVLGTVSQCVLCTMSRGVLCTVSRCVLCTVGIAVTALRLDRMESLDPPEAMTLPADPREKQRWPPLAGPRGRHHLRCRCREWHRPANRLRC